MSSDSPYDHELLAALANRGFYVFTSAPGETEEAVEPAAGQSDQASQARADAAL
ncbi:hypothetical protein [Brevundimonas nasdae]|uniref:Uncharacterized protein n=1 Tax=Brevundimonas nasdae TaxID=172043 RepID=A0ABX8TI44_9CAUL|nr:hypothetical protein [Brevundimonas nasdae]QYC10669.1 hypothetical protein KWG56_01215 [Brevundimonas nasdae]QYC13456.1 hypothetical protein KWG63_14770 [Brevundimonas nasdae]